MKKIIRALPLAAAYLIIIYFSLKHSSGEPPLFENIDKVQHFIAYFTLGLVVYFTFKTTPKKIIGLLFSSALGIGIEFIQGILPYRDMSFYDGVSDVTGLLCGFFIYHLFSRQLDVFFNMFGFTRVQNKDK